MSSLQLTPLTTVSSPQALFADLGQFVRMRYFSKDTVFQTPGMPYDENVIEAGDYYYIDG